jgi:asparagine synthase (glutamine-hydrolysing)
LAWHLEEPRVGQSYPNYYIAQLASKFCKVVLAGTGGDEIFAGYPWRYYQAIAGSENSATFMDNYYQYWQRLIPDTLHSALFKPIWNDLQHISTRDIFKPYFAPMHNKSWRFADAINACLYFESKTFLHGLLVIEDKLSMAHSLDWITI